MGMESHPRVRAWVEPGFKLVVGSGSEGERVGLYDLGAKEGETQDISATQGERAKRMREAMNGFMKEKLTEVGATPKR
jgi:hypothetical protein